MLPPAIEAFARLPVWNTVFLLIAMGVAVYCGLAYRASQHRQDFFYMLLGLYLAAVQVPIVFPSPGQATGADSYLPGSGMSFLVVIPALVLLVLGVRAR